MPKKQPPIVIEKGELLPKPRAPIMPSKAVEDKRRRTGRRAKHKKKVAPEGE